MLTCALVGKFKYVGVIIGILVNIVGVASAVLVHSLTRSGFEVRWVPIAVEYSGWVFAAGVLAGFAAAMIRMIDSASTSAVLADSLSGAGAVNSEPSIPMGELPRQE